mgnify:CR=1 FL=1
MHNPAPSGPTTSSRHKAAHITVHGQVQGVGFRYYARTNALRLGVYGWVRNRADGSVEIWAEGTPDRLQQFINAVRQGPTYSTVTGLDVDWREPAGRDRSFRIRD